MSSLVIEIPRLNDQAYDFQRMARIWAMVMEADANTHMSFDFSGCSFLRPNAVVFLGGLVRFIQARGGAVSLLVDSMQEAVRANLEQNGFAHAMGADMPPWKGNSIPFKEYRDPDKDGIVASLKEDWLGRNWVNVSDALTSEITGQMWEIFANAFEHGESPTGVLSCGQHYPNRKELLLAIADFGVGIPHNVRAHVSAPGDAMQWAFSAGNSTAEDCAFPRGMGLNLLKDFICKNKGRLEIYSHDGYARIDEYGERYESSPAFFAATVVQVRVICDDKLYCLADEAESELFF